MKAKNVIFLLSFGLLLFQGCIPSLHPLYTKSTLALKAEMPGTWVDVGLDQPMELSAKNTFEGKWIFKKNSDKSYRLIHFADANHPTIFDVHLVKLGKDYFMNFYPDAPTKEERATYNIKEAHSDDLSSMHYFPVNTFAKVVFEPDQLSIALFDGEFLEKLLDQNRIRIKHEKTNNGYILTAQPEELQKFIVKYADEEAAFPDPMILKRRF